uniref:Uncharacterized protein n=1 Tax=Lepeophtheirus salmonis TaxID=72036 RepID=A0A0K2VLI1_LEPSM
MSRCRGSGRK